MSIPIAQPLGTSRVAWPKSLRTRGWKITAWLVAAVVVAFAVYLSIIYPWISGWGATEEEIRATLPGDELVRSSRIVTTKAITIQAQPQQVWPWLVQLGVDRGGMYSYLWVENGLLRLGVENSNEIRPEWQTLKVGDFIRFTPKEYALNPGPGLWVLALEPQRSLVGCFGLETLQPDCNESATWQFVLEPAGNNATRLILRSHTSGAPAMLATTGAKIGYAIQFYMERKMLLEIKARAEALELQQLARPAQAKMSEP